MSTPKSRSRQKQVKQDTSLGPIKGYTCFTNENTRYYNFKQIPYAHIPIGPLRFAPPVEITSWTEKDVLKKAQEMPFGRDNVLLLNIYTPQVKKKDSEETFDRPVIVFVPGDIESSEGCNAFEFHGPHFLMNQDIVLVVVSYRLGILGFLKFNDPQANAPGDVGLKDIKMAFAWVRREIESFGGDPDNITAYGADYGATYVRKLLMSPLYDNCFDKMILSSCVDFKISNFLFEDGSYIGPNVAEELDYDGALDDDLGCVEFLRSLKGEDIRSAQCDIFQHHTNEVVHKIDIKAIMDETTYHDKMPVMIGYNSQEGQYEHRSYQDIFSSSTFGRFIKRYTEEIGVNEDLDATLKMVAYKYCSADNMDKDIDEFTQDEIRAELTSDLMYNIRIFAIVKSLVAGMRPKKVFLYRFDVELELNYAVRREDWELLPETCHGDELGYLFKTPRTKNLRKDALENHAVQRMTRLWALFAKNGNPNPEILDDMIHMKWLPIKKELSHCFEICNTQVDYCKIPEIQRMEFWEKIFGVQFCTGPIMPTEIRRSPRKKKSAIRGG